VVHSRDDEEVGVFLEVKSLEKQPQFSQTKMGQYWLKFSDRPEIVSVMLV